MASISHSIANRTSAAVVCWVERPFVVLATGQSWTFLFSKLELMGEPIEKLTGPLPNLSLVQHAIMNTSNFQSENWRRSALERPCYAIDTTTSNNLDVAISTPVPQQPMLRDILLPPLILPPSMMGGFGHGEKASVPSCDEPEAASAAAAPALISDPKQHTCCLGSMDFSTADDSQAAPSSTAALHQVSPVPSFRPTVTVCCKAKNKLAAATVLTPAILAALQGQPLPAAARTVGMSATAFKRACRRLGIRRWSFSRGQGRRRLGGGSPMERSDDAATPV